MSVVSRAGDVVMFLTGNDLSDLERDIYYLKIFQISSTTLLDFFLISAFHFLELHFYYNFSNR